MATKEELFAAILLLKEFCKNQPICGRDQSCQLWGWCCRNSEKTGWNSPDRWPDPEEGGGEDG